MKVFPTLWNMSHGYAFDKRILLMLSMNMFDGSPTGNLPLEALRTFVAAAEWKNFTRAGHEVCRTQSAVSMQIKRLETGLGRTLFERTGRTVTLTPDGELLLGYARKLLRLQDEALASLSAPQITGAVNLGVPDDFALQYLPAVLANFARNYPKIRVDVHCDTTPELLRDFKDGKLDVCIATSDGSPAMPSGCRDLMHIPLVWAGSRDLDIDAVWKRDTEPLSLAVYHEGCIFRRWALEALEHHNIPYRIAFASVSLAAILAAVQSGLVVSPLASSCLDNSHRILPPESGLPPLPRVGVSLYQRQDSPHEAVSCLAQFVADRFTDTGIPHTPKPSPAS